MKLTTLLKLQVLYFVLGVAYNCLSLYFTATGRPALSATQPVMGLLSMAVYALFLVPGFMRKIVLYRVLMGVAIVVMGYGGVVTHIINIFTQPQLYPSMIAWAGALGINLFGLVLNVMAVFGWFKK